MDTVTLRTKAGVGAFEFTRRDMIKHESGNEYLAPLTFKFNFDNNFKTAVPKHIWEDVSLQYVDAKNGIRYCDILSPL